MEDIPLLDFAIALFIGALVGIEREKKLANEQGIGIGGIRTFILFAEAGALGAWLSVQFKTPLIFAATGALVTAIIITGYLASIRSRADAFGLTTEVAALVVFLLGGTVIFGFRTLSVALAITTSAVLAYKREMHRFVGQIAREDLYAGLKLLIATFIILPVLPNSPVDPWGALNPYKMWLLVILISGLSLVGYVASRLLGTQRGIPLTGLFGGLVSSTAVSLAFAKQSREEPARPGHAGALASGLFLAWAVMAVRVLAIVAVLSMDLLVSLIAPMAAMVLVSAGAGLLCYRWSTSTGVGEGTDVPLKNPFSLRSAMKFATLFAAVLLIVKFAEGAFQGKGLYAISLIAGLTDVDPIALSMAEFAADGGRNLWIAKICIVIAALANTASKCGLVLALGRGPIRARALATALAAIVATVIATFVF